MALWIRLAFLPIIVFGITACGDDSVGSSDCTEIDVTGRYEGTLECMTNGSRQSDLYAFEVNRNGSGQLDISDILGSTTVEWSGCDIFLPEVRIENDFGIVSTTEIAGVFLENMVQFTRITTTDGQVVTCTFMGVK